VFAMAAERDLPGPLAGVHPRHRVPHRAVLAAGAAVLAGVALGGLVGAVAFSAFTVLLYYAVANAAALRLPSGRPRAHRLLAGFGLASCLVLAVSLPLPVVIIGAMLLAGLLAVRAALSPETRW
jgi:basic amino acid/polyamine antiporter, APA family